MERSRFAVKLGVKRERDARVAQFLLALASSGEQLLAKQLALCAEDHDNPPPSAPPLELLPPPRIVSYQPRPLPPPPPDLSAPPSEPIFNDMVLSSPFKF